MNKSCETHLSIWAHALVVKRHIDDDDADYVVETDVRRASTSIHSSLVTGGFGWSH